MNRIRLTLLLLLANCSLVLSQAAKDEGYYQLKGYQTFPQFSFAVKCSCTLEDISRKMNGDYDLTQACIMNENSFDKLVMYQVLVKKCPEGFIHAPESERKKFEEKLSSFFEGQKQKVVFNGVNSTVISYTDKGRTGKAIVFIKNGATYTFNLITNDGLDQKFNALTNNIKFY